MLIEEDHDVVIIESNKERIDEISEDLDCGFINGDGTKPEILNEADPQKTDILFCNTELDQSNIIANLLAKTLGYKRVVSIVRDSSLEQLCSELQLENTILISRMTSNFLHKLVYETEVIDEKSLLKNGASLFSLTASKNEEKEIKEIKLPQDTQIVWIYRGEEYIPANPDIKLQDNDEVIILTNVEHMDELKEQFERKNEEKG